MKVSCLSIFIFCGIQFCFAQETETSIIQNLREKISKDRMHQKVTVLVVKKEDMEKLKVQMERVNIFNSFELNNDLKSLKEIFVSPYTPEALTDISVILGNLTWGLINTVIGTGVLLVSVVPSFFVEDGFFPALHYCERNPRQLNLDIEALGKLLKEGDSFSLGLFQFNLSRNEGMAHEGGHAAQSAVLGPFYLPTVFVSYLISFIRTGNFHGGFIEHWANDWK